MCLWLHPVRSLLTVLGIFIGVASVIWLLAISKGIGDEAVRQVESLGADTIMIRTVKPPSEKLSSTGLTPYGLMRDEYDMLVATVPTIKSALPIREMRRQFESLGLLVVNMVSSPGTGKTSFLRETLSRLRTRGIPVAGEYEVKNAQAMKIMDSFGAGGSFTEYYAMDWNEDVVLMGHDGPGHVAIAQGKTKVRPLKVYHGKVGRGLSVEMSVKHGPVTLLSVVESGDGRLKLLVAEGESVPGPILEIGNTNRRYKFGIGARRFMNEWNVQGPAHHCAVGVGHIAGKIEKLGRLLGIETVRVC